MLQHQDYDKLFKENFQRLSQRLLHSFLGLDIASLQSVSTTLPRTIERRADFVALGKHPASQQEEIFHLEFQSQVHPKMNKRGLLYYSLLYDKYELPINQYVIYLGNGNWTAPTTLEHASLNYKYQVIKLNEIDYTLFVASNDPEEIIFSILANFQGEDKEAVIAKIIKALENKSKNQKKLQKYIQQLEILANLRNLQPLIIKHISTMSIYFDIEKDLRYQQGEERGIEKGIQKGIEKSNRLFVESLLQNTDFDDAKIALLVGVTADYVMAMRAEMKLSHVLTLRNS
jgi:predicted transposase/invertase (TIGR01784 family)